MSTDSIRFENIVSNVANKELVALEYNLFKCVNSKAALDEYSYLISNYNCLDERFCIYSFQLPEYRCFSGNEVEVFDICLKSEVSINTKILLQHCLMNIVYRVDDKSVELIGKESSIAKYKDQYFTTSDKIFSQRLKTFVSIPLKTPGSIH